MGAGRREGLVALLLLAACAGRPTEDERREARGFLDLLARNAPIPDERLAPAMHSPQMEAVRKELAGANAAAASELGYRFMTTKGSPSVLSIDYEIETPHGPDEAVVTLERTKPLRLAGLHVRRVAVTPPGAHGAATAAIVAAMIAAALLTLWALVRLWRAPPARKWPWALFIVCGLGKVVLDSGSGRVAVQVLAFQVFSAGAMQLRPSNAWVYAVSLPLGAIVYLARYRRGS